MTGIESGTITSNRVDKTVCIKIVAPVTNIYLLLDRL
jgi:hypothetical protein